MAYCRNCGVELVDSAKFCQRCGTPTGKVNDGYGQRQKEYAGKLYKCPNCGEVLNSFELNCPACGCELRGAHVTSAVKVFTLKLEAIEAQREYEKPRGFFSSLESYVSKTDEQKISLIKSFSIPNTREDLLEFMILATSNINTGVYDSTSVVSKGETEVNAAWLAKVEQTYEKARISYSSEDVFRDIQALYLKSKDNIKHAKKKVIVKWFLIIGWLPLIFVIVIIANLIIVK